MRNPILLIAVTSAMFAGCAAEPEPAAPALETEAAAPAPGQLPAMIVAERGGFIPEGIEYDTTKRSIPDGLALGGLNSPHTQRWPGDAGRERP